MISLLLLARLTLADDIDSNLVTHVRAAPRTRVSHLPGMKEGYCIFALVSETDSSPVTVDSFEVVSGTKNLLHNIPTGLRTLPRTPNWYTWEVMALLKDSSVVRVTAYGESRDVELAQLEDGRCSVKSATRGEK